MTDPHEPVRMRFRGQMRCLPLMSFAAAFGRDIESTARALDTLIQGPPDPVLPVLSQDAPRPASLPLPGEGGMGGGAQEQTHMSCHVNNKQNMGNGGPGERGIPETTKEITALLGGEANPLAIEKLVREHPRPLVLEALRRTQAIAPERIRESRAALFTGIVRRLAQAGFRQPDS